jgi:transcriptional regulator
MYKIPHFKEQDRSRVIAFMNENSFVLITGNGGEYPVATQIPVIVDEKDGRIILRGHLMKNTDHHKAFLKNENVLVLFTGPHCYISASWYNDAGTASTWNYMTVHARGKISFTDKEGTLQALAEITRKYEGEKSAASFHNIPESYIDDLIGAIVGFTIEVESIENVFKLSQNKTIAEQKNIVEKLLQVDDYNSKKIAEEIKRRIP